MIVLQPKKNPDEDKPKKKEKKNKYSGEIIKGELPTDIILYGKKQLLKLLKGFKNKKNSKRFQENEGMRLNFILKGKKPFKIRSTIGAIKKSTLNNNTDGYVLLELTGGYYKAIPNSSMSKLSLLAKVAYTRQVVYIPDSSYLDDDDEKEEQYIVDHREVVVNTVNELLYLLLEDESNYTSIVKLTQGDYWYCSYEIIHRIMIQLKDGTKVFYKSLNDFLVDFDLELFKINNRYNILE